MQLYYDLDISQWVNAPGTTNPPLPQALIRGDTPTIIVTFCRGARIVTLGSSTYKFGIKKQGVFSGSYLSYTSAAVVSGELSKVVPNNPGTGYTTQPAVTVSGDGSGAVVTAQLSGGSIIGYIVEDPGIGYTAATITVAAPGSGTTATAIAFVAPDYVFNPDINTVEIIAELAPNIDHVDCYLEIQITTGSVVQSTTRLPITIYNDLNQSGSPGPSMGSTWFLAPGKTFSVNNTITLSGTDGTTFTFPSVSGSVLTDGSTVPIKQGVEFALNGPTGCGKTRVFCNASGSQADYMAYMIVQNHDWQGTGNRDINGKPASRMAIEYHYDTGTRVQCEFNWDLAQDGSGAPSYTRVFGIAATTDGGSYLCAMTFYGDFAASGKINNVTLTAPASAATLTLGSGKAITISNTITLTGTDGTSFNVNAPKLLRAHASASQHISSGGTITVQLDTADEDTTGGDFNTGTYTFTPASGKKYKITARMRASVSSGYYVLFELQKNGSNYKSNLHYNAVPADWYFAEEFNCYVTGNGSDAYTMVIITQPGGSGDTDNASASMYFEAVEIR